MTGYMGEFVALALIHFLAVVAPGPDFAVTIRQSVRHGRSAGVGTALGIGAGISVHVVYTLLGVGALMHTTPWLLQVASWLGAAYLLYLGILFIRQAGRQTTGVLQEAGAGRSQFSALVCSGLFNQCHQPQGYAVFSGGIYHYR